MTRRPVALMISALVAASLLVAIPGCAARPARVAWPVRSSLTSKAPSSPGTAMARRLSTVTAPEKGAYLGVFCPPAPFKASEIDRFSALCGRPPAIVMWYQPWGAGGMNRFDAAACASVLARGAVPMITWEPWAPGDRPHFLTKPSDQPEYSLSVIAGGKYDAYIRGWAREIKALGGPVMLRPMHEMNGNWYPWCGSANGNSPQAFVAAWRHIHDLFREEGAINVTWVWSVNRVSAPATPENSYAAYYPGDDYVDWTGLSGFNWGTTARGSWLDFESVNGAALRELRKLGKPIVIGETGSVETGGDKAAWLTDAYATIASAYPEVKAVVYYDASEARSVGTRDWRVDSSAGSLAAFRRAIASSHFLAAPAEAVSGWKSRLGEDDRSRLGRLRPVY